MLNSVVDLFSTAFEACISWFDSVFAKTGMAPLYLGAVAVCFAVGFLLSPFKNGLPGGLSDSAADQLDSSGGKYWDGTTSKANFGYRGKYERGYGKYSGDGYRVGKPGYKGKFEK